VTVGGQTLLTPTTFILSWFLPKKAADIRVIYEVRYLTYIWQRLEIGRDARDDFIVQAPKVESLMGISASMSTRPTTGGQSK
jgi:hypothetical protein